MKPRNPFLGPSRSCPSTFEGDHKLRLLLPKLLRGVGLFLVTDKHGEEGGRGVTPRLGVGTFAFPDFGSRVQQF